MNEVSTLNSPTNENPFVPSKDPALRGMRIFIKASMVCPASISAQGALIADYCQQRNLEPLALGYALSDRTDLLEQITSRANNMHAQRNRRVEVDAKRVKGIMMADFTVAEEMAYVLNQEDLRTIYEYWYGIHKKQPDPTDTIEGKTGRNADTLLMRRREELLKDAIHPNSASLTEKPAPFSRFLPFIRVSSGVVRRDLIRQLRRLYDVCGTLWQPGNSFNIEQIEGFKKRMSNEKPSSTVDLYYQKSPYGNSYMEGWHFDRSVIIDPCGAEFSKKPLPFFGDPSLASRGLYS